MECYHNKEGIRCGEILWWEQKEVGMIQEILMIWGAGLICIILLFYLISRYCHRAEERRIKRLKKEFREAINRSNKRAAKERTKFGNKKL